MRNVTYKKVFYDEQGRPRVRAGGRLRPAEKRICKICFKPFWAITYSPSLYCSRECRYIHNSRVLLSKRVAKACIICGKVVYRAKSKAWRYVTCANPDCIKQRKRWIAKQAHLKGIIHAPQRDKNGKFA